MSRDGVYITGIEIPIAQEDSGLTAANKIVNSLDAIDQHDHDGSAGGKKINFSNVEIGGDLDLKNYSLNNTVAVRFYTAGTTDVISTGDFGLYFKDNELWCRNATNYVQITDKANVKTSGTGSLSGVTGSAGVNFDSGNAVWELLATDGTTKAGLQCGNIEIENTTNSITLDASNVTSDYDLLFPAQLPGGSTQQQINVNPTSGVMTFTDAINLQGTITTNTIPYFYNSVKLASLPALGNGELLIGRASNSPINATLTGTTNRITVTNGSGSITLNTPQDLHTSAQVQFTRIGLGNAVDASYALKATGNSLLTGTLNVTDAVTLGTTLSDVNNNTDTVITKSSSNVLHASRKFSTSATADTFAVRDSSANLTCNQLNSSTLSISGLSTLQSAKITSLAGASNCLAYIDTSGNLLKSNIVVSGGDITSVSSISCSGTIACNYLQTGSIYSLGGEIKVNTNNKLNSSGLTASYGIISNLSGGGSKLTFSTNAGQLEDSGITIGGTSLTDISDIGILGAYRVNVGETLNCTGNINASSNLNLTGYASISSGQLELGNGTSSYIDFHGQPFADYSVRMMNDVNTRNLSISSNDLLGTCTFNFALVDVNGIMNADTIKIAGYTLSLSSITDYFGNTQQVVKWS